jgi:hypothetical protein
MTAPILHVPKSDDSESAANDAKNERDIYRDLALDWENVNTNDYQTLKKFRCQEFSGPKYVLLAKSTSVTHLSGLL